MIERRYDLDTGSGQMNVFVCHPEEGGPHPVVVFYQDAPGIRHDLFDMVRRIAVCGYYVALPNLYYRMTRDVVIDANQAEIPGTWDNRRMFELILGLTNTMAVEDTRSLLAEVARDPYAKPGAFGSVGYCMGGRFATCAAAAFPDMRAVATFCPTWMVMDSADSAHRVAGSIRGELYMGCAEDDPYFPPEQIATMRTVLEGAGVTHRIEIYPGTRHPFAFRDRDTHVRSAEERHWERLFALLRKHLG